MTTPTLTQIRTKIRRLTGRPSPQQISDSEIDEYINTFYLYDMPAHLKLFEQKTTFEFMTEANVDEYDLSQMPITVGAQTVSASNVYTSFVPPLFVAGYQSFWSQDRQQFFNQYPMLSDINSSVLGNGGPGPYSVTFGTGPFLQNKVTVGAIDSTGNVINVVDLPTNRTNGTWQVINSSTIVTGSINYLTGAATITFNNTIPTGNEITFTAVPYVANRPQAALYFANTITLRPVPDKSYLVQLNAFKRPTAFLNTIDEPELEQWWQYIAYGATKKIFEDTSDPEGVVAIMPALKEQENLVNRRSLVQRTNQRTATIYTEQTSFSASDNQNRF